MPRTSNVAGQIKPVLQYEDHNTAAEGLELLRGYLSKLDAQAGHLLSFDRRRKRSWEKRISRRDNATLPKPYDHFRATGWRP